MRLSFTLLLAIFLLGWAGNRLASSLAWEGGAVVVFTCVFPVLVAALLAALGQVISTVLDPAPKRSRGLAAVGVYVREYGYFVWCFLIAQPLLAWLMPIHRAPAQPRAVAVFAHGFACNRGLWWLWRGRWHRAGYATMVLDLAPGYWSLEANLEHLARALEEAAQRHPGKPVCIVGHSMGGLIGRIQLNRREPKMDACVSLGAPHRGTLLAGQMGGKHRGPPVPSSPWLVQLNQRQPPQGRADLLNVRSANDCIVVPASSCVVDPDNDWTRDRLGHMGLTQSLALCAEILGELEQILEPKRAI